MIRCCTILACILALMGCGGDANTSMDGGTEPDSGPVDGGSLEDLGPPPVDIGPPTPTYEGVAAILLTSCASSGVCHGGTGAGAAQLNFAAEEAAGRPLTNVLVDQAACQYDAMPLVDPGNPDNSWLMIKLTGPHTNRVIDFTPAPDWDPGLVRDENGDYPRSTCPRTVSGEISFGRLMPLSMTRVLSPERIDAIRTWIANGAPGPTDL